MRLYVMLTLVFLFSGFAFAQKGEWTNFNDGLETAAKSKKKVLVDVFTDWCAWCKRMDKDVYEQPDVKAYLAKNFILVKMDAESNNEVTYNGQSLSETQLAQDLGIDGYPSTVFFLPNGEVITAVPGYVPPEKFLLILKYIAEDHYNTMEWEDFETKQASAE
ncbi:MAG: thioredoxin family protein [Ignavibacteriales bacterium]|nr:thioredoxin family protein [Ignavibacteriales bacterium]